jgi:hypothetical protein
MALPREGEKEGKFPMGVSQSGEKSPQKGEF